MSSTPLAVRRADLLVSIAKDQQDVRLALRHLAGGVESSLNPGVHIRASPLSWTLGAFLVGMWLGRPAASVR